MNKDKQGKGKQIPSWFKAEAFSEQVVHRKW